MLYLRYAEETIYTMSNKQFHLLLSNPPFAFPGVTRGWQTGAVRKPRSPFVNRGRPTRSRRFLNCGRYSTTPPSPPPYGSFRTASHRCWWTAQRFSMAVAVQKRLEHFFFGTLLV